MTFLNQSDLSIENLLALFKLHHSKLPIALHTPHSNSTAVALLCGVRNFQYHFHSQVITLFISQYIAIEKPSACSRNLRAIHRYDGP